MEFKDYYQVLGVSPEADDKTIKAAYRKLARQYHPDVSSEKDAEARFKEVAEAYEVLRKPDKRAEYDELRQAYQQRGRQRAPGGDGFAGAESFNMGEFEDFLNSVFGGGGGFSGFRGAESFSQQPFSQQPFSQQGRDLEMEMPVFLEETLKDTAKPVRFRVPEVDEHGRMREVTRSVNVKIPAGVTDGARIRVKGQGAPGMGNAPSGDLYLHIRLVPHPLFDVEGHNLIITVPLAPWEAALGAKIPLPTLSGKIQLTIPPNSQSGQRLRIKGKGLVGKHGQGDLFAVLKVVMPKKSDTQIRDLWSQLAKKADFDPRAEWSK